MQFIVPIISFVCFLLFYRFIYHLFESSGFKGVLTFRIILEVILMLVALLVESVPINFSDILMLFPSLIGIFIGMTIITGIEYYAYNKTNSFLTFMILNFLISILIYVGLIAILFTIVIIAVPDLFPKNINSLIIIPWLIVIITIIILVIVNSITNKKANKLMKNARQNAIINENINDKEDNQSNIFCSECGFKLPRNAKFCMRCGKHF